MNDYERAICARLKLVRESLWWSQSAFAKHLGISRDKLHAVESGHTPLRYDIAWELRRRFGISLRWLEEGFGFADDFVLDDLPEPSETGLPSRTLLSAVAKQFPHGLEPLTVVLKEGSNPSNNANPKALSTRAKSIESAAIALIQGEERKLGKTDTPHRVIIEDFIKRMSGYWVSRAPLGQVEALSNKLCEAVSTFLEGFPPESEDRIEQRWEQMTWERLRMAKSRQMILSFEDQKKGLQHFTTFSKSIGVKSELNSLIERLKRATSQYGMKGKLADQLGVPQSRVSEWLSGKNEPGGETTLRLLAWVTEVETQQPKSPGRASTRPEPKTQLRKSKHEKPKSGRKKR